MFNRKEIKRILKEEALKIISEQKNNSIEDLVYSIMDYQVMGREKKAQEYYGILFPRLSSMGFDREKLMKIKGELQSLTNEREVSKFLGRWKLTDEYINKNKVNTYKLILTIPYATSSNKDEKIKKLKYDLASNGIKNVGYKEMDISFIGDAGTLGKALDLKILVKVKTKLKKTEIENILQPDYGIEKIKEFDVE